MPDAPAEIIWNQHAGAGRDIQHIDPAANAREIKDPLDHGLVPNHIRVPGGSQPIKEFDHFFSIHFHSQYYPDPVRLT